LLTFQLDAAVKVANADFSAALHFQNVNLSAGSIRVRVTDKNLTTSDAYTIGQVEIPLSLVSSVPTGTEVVCSCFFLLLE
jgi:hypothetical protein